MQDIISLGVEGFFRLEVSHGDQCPTNMEGAGERLGEGAMEHRQWVPNDIALDEP